MGIYFPVAAHNGHLCRLKTDQFGIMTALRTCVIGVACVVQSYLSVITSATSSP